MSDPRTKLVAAGYDAMADTWEDWSTRVIDDPRRDWLESLLAALPANARVVELDAGSLDAVASFYVFNHVPSEPLAPVLERIHFTEPEGPAQFPWTRARR
jgi:hypothetical protein